MASEDCHSSLLLALPDPCLLAVLQCCADNDQCSLFSAARTHSRLHQAAVLALHSITVAKQEQADGVLRYAKHVDGLILEDESLCGTDLLSSLPKDLRLRSLQLSTSQLQHGDGLQDILGRPVGAALKQLYLWQCELYDRTAANVLAATLCQLPTGLEHLCVSGLAVGRSRAEINIYIPARVLHQLQQLTHLELTGVQLIGPEEEVAPGCPTKLDSTGRPEA
jgi:hypothetical protein